MTFRRERLRREPDEGRLCRRCRARCLLDEVAQLEELRLSGVVKLLQYGTDHFAEALERLLGFPDIDDTPAIGGRTRGMREDPGNGPVAKRTEASPVGQARPLPPAGVFLCAAGS